MKGFDELIDARTLHLLRVE